ncbi:hypothetical protein FDI24_gp246 [Acidovorax phage ACP17]|uniref:Uncharacterized protein n=1 Tax=Acidovorax phage ACP17 TaxID=2010329 RepID=A0A223AIZ7_9CAUD|nr:hypothetical protein FDI24_gp246 [Acidovorax phage ACP17]ASS33945.1 hypothetical protein [Acidovorax phage ACP17]
MNRIQTLAVPPGMEAAMVAEIALFLELLSNAARVQEFNDADDARDVVRDLLFGTQGETVEAAGPNPNFGKPVDEDVRAFLENKNAAIMYLGTTTVAYVVEASKRRFADVAIAHLGSGDQFKKSVGRRLAINRINNGASIRLRIPEYVDSTDRACVNDFIADTFSSQAAFKA